MKADLGVVGAAIAAVALVLWISVVQAGDMTLTLDSGAEILLHDDHTWDFADRNHTPQKNDITISTGDGSTIHIATNQTWAYVSGDKGSTTTEHSYLASVFAVGTAQGPDQFDTRLSAMAQAATHLARQLIESSGQNDLTIEKVKACINAEGTSTEVKENYLEKWKIEVKISADQYQIRAIMECAADTGLVTGE